MRYLRSQPFLIFAILITFCACEATQSQRIRAEKPASLTSAQREVVIAVGDLNFSGKCGRTIIENPAYPWENTKPVLNAAQVLIGNLETPLSSRGTPYMEKTWVLRSEPRTVKTLTSAGFDLVTLANNHIMDYGPMALADTLKTLRDARVLYTGAGMDQYEACKPVFITTPGGIRFGFLAYSLTFPEAFWAGASRAGASHSVYEQIRSDIQALRNTTDLVVVSFHWGKELSHYPSDYQKKLAHLCIKAGASLVLGHHPHVLQGLEIYQGGLIAYSLGNFVFGSLSTKVNDSMILAVEYDKTGLKQAKIYPVNINNYEVEYQPRLRKGTDAERVLRDLREYSEQFDTPITSEGGFGTIRIEQE